MMRVCRLSKIRHCERNEAISAANLGLPRRFAPRSDEPNGHRAIFFEDVELR